MFPGRKVLWVNYFLLTFRAWTEYNVASYAEKVNVSWRPLERLSAKEAEYNVDFSYRRVEMEFCHEFD